MLVGPQIEIAAAAAKSLAKETGSIVSLSGPIDVVTDGERVETIANGSPLMPKVTSMGCAASALTGAYLSVDCDALEAAVNAMAVMGMAGENAARKCFGTGSLAVCFLDELSCFDPCASSGNVKQWTK